jgi:hypothetical protein
MPTLSVIAGFLAALLTQSPPPAPACYVLTRQEVASLVGSANPKIVTTTGTESTCTFQSRGAIVIVVLAKSTSADAAKAQWETKKRAAAARDVAGWLTPAYVGAIDTPKDHAAIVGVYSGLTFVEARAIDNTKKTAALNTTLQTAMKAAAARLVAIQIA